MKYDQDGREVLTDGIVQSPVDRYEVRFRCKAVISF